MGKDLFGGSAGLYGSQDSGQTMSPVNNGMLNPHVQFRDPGRGSLCGHTLRPQLRRPSLQRRNLRHEGPGILMDTVNHRPDRS